MEQDSWATMGIKNLLVICPGFASDCVETLEEIAIQGKESFLKSGGKNFDMIPCLNDNEDHINDPKIQPITDFDLGIIQPQKNRTQ